MKHHIMGIAVEKRSKNAPDLQKILTQFGCIIKMRLGLHETTGNSCSEEGLILLHLAGDEDEIKKFEKELKDLEGIRFNIMKV